jgi:hypothetical protein
MKIKFEWKTLSSISGIVSYAGCRTLRDKVFGGWLVKNDEWGQ